MRIHMLSEIEIMDEFFFSIECNPFFPDFFLVCLFCNLYFLTPTYIYKHYTYEYDFILFPKNAFFFLILLVLINTKNFYVYVQDYIFCFVFYLCAYIVVYRTCVIINFKFILFLHSFISFYLFFVFAMQFYLSLKVVES